MPSVQFDLMFAGHVEGMDTTTTSQTDEQAAPHRRVRTDLGAGIGVLAVVIGGNLLWHASDAGIVAAFGSH
jgi:hypothetical protein